MSEKEALKKIKQLLYKYRISKSKKMKEFYLSDILALQQYLLLNFNIDIDNTCILDDVLFDIEDYLDDNYESSVNDFYSLNDKTRFLANGVINIFDKNDYACYTPVDRSIYDTKLLKESLIEFLSLIDYDILKKFYKYAKEGILVGNYEDLFLGVCFNLTSDNKQILAINNSDFLNEESVSEVGFFVTLAHEVGHGIHKNMINSSGINKNFPNPFEESISLLFEKMYLRYLEKNNIDIKNELKNEYNTLLINSILARAGSFAIEDNNLYDGYLIPDQYFTNEYFDKYTYLFDSLYSFEYLEPLIYFYGELIASRVISCYKDDYKSGVKSLLEVLMKWENKDSKDLLEEIGLNGVPKEIIKDLRKVKN